MGVMKIFLASAIAVALAAGPGAQGNDPVALAAKVQQRYNGIKDIQADFVQTYEGGVLRTRTTERGTVAIKRPGRMRFTYTKPEKKEFVSDGSRLYTYLVADKQVIVSPAPGPDQGDIPAMFLAGHSDLARDYTPTFTQLPGAAGGLVTMKLVPKKKSEEYESLGIGIDPKTLQIQFLSAVDTQGGRSSFTFSNLKENRGLSDKQFEFRIPRGVDVVTNGGRAQ
jgi:outer membrane lipoprotein carrier protein